MPETVTRSAPVTVEHVTIVCRRRFEEVHAALLRLLPQLDPALLEMLTTGDSQRIADERENGPKLWLFLTRDHGALLAAEGRPGKAMQYDIGNPLTAESMTRHKLGAALYAPLRVALYEDAAGNAVFEYDRPSSLFGQFGDEAVTHVGRELDMELDEVLLAAAG